MRVRGCFVGGHTVGVHCARISASALWVSSWDTPSETDVLWYADHLPYMASAAATAIPAAVFTKASSCCVLCPAPFCLDMCLLSGVWQTGLLLAWSTASDALSTSAWCHMFWCQQEML
jgi:hypothetical protein